jgi:hypothetical protein
MPHDEEPAATVLMRLINQIKRDLLYEEATSQITAALYAAAAAQVKGSQFRPFDIDWTPDLHALYALLKEELSTNRTA